MDLNKIAKQLQKFEKTYEKYQRLYQADEKITPEEQQHLDQLSKQLEQTKLLYRKYKKAQFSKVALEDMLDDFVEQLDEKDIVGDVANIKSISLSANIAKNTLFDSRYWGAIEIMTPPKRNMQIRLVLTANQFNIHCWPHLMIDVWGPFNGYLRAIQLNLKNGQISFDVDGYFTGSIQKKFRTTIQNLLKNTLLDTASSNAIYPFYPFTDPDIAAKLKQFQTQLIAKFDSAGGSSGVLDKSSAPSIGSSLNFVKKYSYNFGKGKAEIEKGSVLQANINIKGGLDHLIQNPQKAKISSITMSCSGIVIYLKNKPQIKIERISYHYGGDLRIDRAEILNEVVNGLKIIELLGKLTAIAAAARGSSVGANILTQSNINEFVIDGVAIGVIEKRVEAMIIDAVKDSLQGIAAEYGFDLMQALGIR